MLTQWFDPEPTFKGLVFARALRDEGHEVEVVTGFPNYPGGRLFPGYKIRPWQREQIDGVRVLRVPLYPSHDSSPLLRSLNYLSFSASAALLGALLTKKPDVIYVTHPPITVGVAATFLGWTKRAPFVYDMLDLWPDALAASGMAGGRVVRLVGFICDWVYRRAAFLVVESPGFQQVLVKRGVPKHKLGVILNWCDERSLVLEPDPAVRASLSAGERFNVVFAGTMGRAQGLESVLQAAELLATADPRVQFVFVGGGLEVEPLRRSASARGSSNVIFLPRMPMSAIGRVLEAADVLLVHLKDDPLFEITVPGKTQAYLSVGKPILMALRGDAADIVSASGGGITCRPADPEDLARAVTVLAAMPPEELRAMGQRGRDYYRAQMSLQVGTRKFLEVFEQVVSGTPARSDAGPDPRSA